MDKNIRLVLRSFKLLSRQTLDVLTVRSAIAPVYCKTLKQAELSRLGNLQYRAAKLVTAFHYTNREK